MKTTGIYLKESFLNKHAHYDCCDKFSAPFIYSAGIKSLCNDTSHLKSARMI